MTGGDAGREGSRWIVLALALGVAPFSLLQSVTVPTLPTIQAFTHTDQVTVSWVVSAFLLAAVVATPIGGRLGDAYGKRRVFLASLALLVVGAVVAAFATSIWAMIVARIVQGFGACVVPLAFGMLRDKLPAVQVPGAVAIVSAVLAVGFGVGIVIAGPVESLLGFHAIFLLPALVALVGGTATRVLVTESGSAGPARIPWVAAVPLAGWLVASLLGLSKATTWGWTSDRTLATFGLAIVLFALWLQIERRVQVPLIDLRLMTLRGVWPANTVALLNGATTVACFAFLPQFFQTPSETGYGFGASLSEAGHLMLGPAFGIFLGGLVSGRGVRLVGVRTLVISGSLISATFLLVLSVWHTSVVAVEVGGGMTAFGAGIVQACLAAAVVGAVPRDQVGVASGMNTNIRLIGGSIGVAVVATLVTAQLQTDGYPVERGYSSAFALLGVVGLVAAGTALFIPRPAQRLVEREAAAAAGGATAPTRDAAGA